VFKKITRCKKKIHAYKQEIATTIECKGKLKNANAIQVI
jgi:hypothetical protein